MRLKIAAEPAAGRSSACRPRLRRLFGALATALVATACPSCSTMSLPDYEPPPSAALPAHSALGGLAVAAGPIVDAAELERVFGEDLVARKLLPVLVRFDNRDASRTFAVGHLEATIAADSGDSAAGVVSGRSGGSEAVAYVGAALVSLPLMFIGLKGMSDAQVVRHAVATNALYAHTLPPGRETWGFLFFSLPDPPATAVRWRLRLGVQELPGGSTSMVELPLAAEIGGRS